MRFSALPLVAALATLSSVHATTLSVQTGCITFENSAGVYHGLCHGSTATAPDISVHINACIDVNAGTYACALNVDDINLSSQIYWGTDNCLYNAGPPASKITCATAVSPPKTLPCNPYKATC